MVAAKAIRTTMWTHAGIDRTGAGLERCLEELARIERRLTPGMTEERNLLESACMIARAALLRTESRGGHFRSDFPTAKRRWQHRHVEFGGVEEPLCVDRATAAVPA
jgi:L-aspartate oxidase